METELVRKRRQTSRHFRSGPIDANDRMAPPFSKPRDFTTVPLQYRKILDDCRKILFNSPIFQVPGMCLCDYVTDIWGSVNEIRYMFLKMCRRYCAHRLLEDVLIKCIIMYFAS